MNLLYRLLLLPLLTISACATLASQPGNIFIEFVQPERFTDFRIQGRQETESSKIFRDQVSSYLSPAVAKRFPGATLSLRFTDIDLAGRLELWRIRKFDDVRFDFDGSPLRLYFVYSSPIRKEKFWQAAQKAWWSHTTSIAISAIPTAKRSRPCSMKKWHFPGGSVL